jgi:hypothetical protein
MDTHVVIGGTLRPDGTLELDARPSLPPGRVRVTVESQSQSPAKRSLMSVLEEIWAERKALNMPGRTKDEIDAEIKAMRDEWEERQQALDQIHEQARNDRQ